MARNLTLTRTEAEMLVDLLEDCDPLVAGTWRHHLAGEIRELFGMVPLDIEKKTQEEELKKKLEKAYG